MSGNLYVLGARGRIGSALIKHAQSLSINTFAIDRVEYNSWQDPDAALRYFKEAALSETDLVICASGIINPRTDADEIIHCNVTVPNSACIASVTLGAKAVSLGTVLEQIIPDEKQNIYVSSKSQLRDLSKDKWLHFQLHTIYGGSAPAPFMFTGLMLSALKESKKFAMTSGEQLREYHHVDDEACAILELAKIKNSGQFDISSGDSIKLSDLAISVFDHFKNRDLLGIGEIQSPDVEAYEPSFNRQSALQTSKFRPAIPSLAQWLEVYI